MKSDLEIAIKNLSAIIAQEGSDLPPTESIKTYVYFINREYNMLTPPERKKLISFMNAEYPNVYYYLKQRRHF